MPYSSREQQLATMDEALQRENVEELKRFVLLVSTERATRKGDLIAILKRAVEGENLRSLWEKLDELQKAAVAETVHNWSGQFQPDRFVAKYGKSPDWGPNNSYGYGKRVSVLGLFIFGLQMPEDLRQRLSAFVPPPIATGLPTIDDLPESVTLPWKRYDYETRQYQTGIEVVPIVQCGVERVALHDLHAVLRLIDAGKVAVSDKTNYPTGATIKAIAAVLLGGDFYDATQADASAAQDKDEETEDEAVGPIRAFAWPLLVQAGRLAELSGKRLTLTKTGQKALSAPPAETLRALWQAWVKTTLLDEMRRINAIKGQTGRGKSSFTALSGRRTIIAKALADCPTGRWVDVNVFMRYMVAANYDFQVSRDLWSLYILDSNYGSLGYDHVTWRHIQGRYLLCLLFEYAATLGLIDVAYVLPTMAPTDIGDLWGADDLSFLSRYDGLMYFRLTPLGAFCLGVVSTYLPAPMEVRPGLKVLPNFEIAVTDHALPADDVLLLNVYAERVSENVWRLDRPKMLAAVEEGHRFAELQELLNARSANELPGTVRQLLKDVEEKIGLLKDRGTARLIECSDPMLAKVIAHDSSTKPFCFLAGERHLVVPTESETAFRRAVRQLGYIVPHGVEGKR